MPAPTDPVLLQERLSSIFHDVEHAGSSWVCAPLSAHPLPVAALRGRLHNATTWLGRVWSAHARGGPAVRRWLTDEPLGSPVPPTNQRLSLRKQFRVALATAFLGASVAAGAYVLTAPLADPFFGLIPPDIFSRLPPYSEQPLDGGPDGEFTPQVGTAPGAPVIARLPVPPAPEPTPAPDAGSSDPVARSGPQSGEPGGTSPHPPALAPEPPTALPPGPGTPPPGTPPPGTAPTTTAVPPTTTAEPPTTDPPTTTVPPTTTTTVPPTTTQPPTTTEPAPTTTEPTGTTPTTPPSTQPTTTVPPTATS